MTQDTEQYRAGFEAWYAPIFKAGEPANMPRRANGEYMRPQDQIAFMSWCAAMQQREASTEPSAIPDVLFDGHAVYQEVMANDPNTPRPTADNVANVLDAVVRLMRKAGSAGAGALPDEAKDAARLAETMDHAQLQALGRHQKAGA